MDLITVASFIFQLWSLETQPTARQFLGGLEVTMFGGDGEVIRRLKQASNRVIKWQIYDQP